jgi:hypothetical protein
MDSAGAKSVMSNDMKELTEGKETITNEIRGHKANLSNPSVSAISSCRGWGTLANNTRHQRGIQEEQQGGFEGTRR